VEGEEQGGEWIQGFGLGWKEERQSNSLYRPRASLGIPFFDNSTRKEWRKRALEWCFVLKLMRAERIHIYIYIYREREREEVVNELTVFFFFFCASLLLSFYLLTLSLERLVNKRKRWLSRLTLDTGRTAVFSSFLISWLSICSCEKKN